MRKPLQITTTVFRTSEDGLKEHLHGKKSVTELEIIHGVLREEKMHGHAFFYFRDPAFIESIPPEQRQNFTTEDAGSAEKLRRLKELIRHAKREEVCSLQENYPDPKALGELVLADLTAVINELFPEGSQPDPLDREAMDHEAYAKSRERIYIGRQEYFDRLDTHAAANDTQPLVILGESGSGKSALLANWVARYRQAHPDALVLQHYIGATPYSADWAAMLRRLMGEFKRRLGLQQDIPDQPDALRSAFPNWLYMAAAKNRVVLVLDALNQLEDRDGAPDLVWLPPVLPENVRLIVSTLPGRPLDEIQKRNWPTLKVELLSTDERRKLIAQYLAQHAKALSAARVERIAAAPPSANPLYLRVLLDELRLVRTHEELVERIGDYLKAESPYALYEKVIARWEQDYEDDSDLVGDTLSLLWAARRGLTETELLQALGKAGEPLPRAKWSPLFLAMSDALINRGGLLTFAHEFLRTAVANAYLPEVQNQRQAHTRLADYFEHQPLGPRRTDELPWQLAEADAWQRLLDLLADRVFFTDAWQRNEFDVRAYWAHIEKNSPLRLVVTFRSALDAPESHSATFLDDLVQLLFKMGHDNEAIRVQEYVVGHSRATNDPKALSSALGQLAVVLQDCGHLDRAMECWKEEASLRRGMGDRLGLTGSLMGQALILMQSGDMDGAMHLLKESEHIQREEGCKKALLITLGNQAGILGEKNDPQAAMIQLKEAERIAREIGDMEGLQSCLHNQSVTLLELGCPKDAMALSLEAERTYRGLGQKGGIWRCLRLQAMILEGQDDLDGAIALLCEAEKVHREVDDMGSVVDVIRQCAELFLKKGDLAEAVSSVKRAVTLARQVGDKGSLLKSLASETEILSTGGSPEELLGVLKEHTQVSLELGRWADAAASLDNQAVILSKLGNPLGAMMLHKQEESLWRKSDNPQLLVSCLTNQAIVLFQELSKPHEAFPLAEEAYRIARAHGLAALARQIEPLLNVLRQAAQGE